MESLSGGFAAVGGTVMAMGGPFGFVAGGGMMFAGLIMGMFGGSQPRRDEKLELIKKMQTQLKQIEG